MEIEMDEKRMHSLTADILPARAFVLGSRTGPSSPIPEPRIELVLKGTSEEYNTLKFHAQLSQQTKL
jgi:hypothetical protein